MTDSYAIINGIVDSVDFSKQSFLNRDKIDWSTLDISNVPSANMEPLMDMMNRLSEKLDSWEVKVGESRLSPEKKEKNFSNIVSIRTDIRKLNNSGYEDLEHFNYEVIYYIQQKLASMTPYAPTSCKEGVKSFSSNLSAELKKVSFIEGDRIFILREAARRLVEKSYQFRVDAYREDIKTEGLTLTGIESIQDGDLLDAACMYASEKYGRGAGSLVRDLFYAKQRGSKYALVDWPFSEEVENIVTCAKALGVKEFAFIGACTSTLNVLNLITKMGLTFKIEEIEQKNYMETELVPVAVVTL
jgi:hypothetical protein